jgi:putative membrane protein
MRASTHHLFIFAAAVVFIPQASLLAQDPMGTPASQTQANQPGRVQAPTTSMQDSSGAPSDTIQEMKDKIFLRKVTEGGLAQVQLGKLASEKATSQDVKDFGQKMADEHAKLNISMAAIADSIGMRLPKNPNKTDQAQYQKLSNLSGDAFDKEYLACVVREHHENMREFRIESQSTSDPDLKAAVDSAAKVIREHLVLASKLAAQNGVPLPAHASKPVAAQPN